MYAPNSSEYVEACLPIAIVTTTGVDSKFASIDQVFNGFGYIGPTAFALPNVKVLIPDDINPDGSLKNIEITLDKVVTRTITWNNSGGQDLFIGRYTRTSGIEFISTGSLNQVYQQENEPSLVRYTMWYKPSENKVYRCDQNSDGSLYWRNVFPCHIGQWFTSSESPYPITKLTIKQVNDGIVKNKYYQLAKTKRRYYKYNSWKQPTFTSDTTWGKVWADSYYSGDGYYQYPWRALDGKTSGGNDADYAAGSSAKTVNWFWDFKEPLKITNVKIWNRNSASSYGGATTYTIYGKIETGAYEQIGTLSLAATAWVSGAVSITSKKHYYGLKIYCSGAKTYVGIGEILLTAYTISEGTSSSYDYYADGLVSYPLVAKTGKHFVSLLDTSTAGTYSVKVPTDTVARITLVGGGGAAAMRGVYDDRGYGWGGGSGGAFSGTFNLTAGTYSVTVGSANNNTTSQTSNSQTSNPTDTSTHDSYVTGVVRVGGGGSGHYNTSYVGAAGASATFTIQPLTTTLNKTGNAGASGSGGKGSAAAATINGGASVFSWYGKGQGCKTSEYSSKRSWINGSNGYVKFEIYSETEKQGY
jgi:hypothetical protein